ncbi:MAG: phosphodiester glycosidase family protein, partial [Verrucomicrobia bacterium]|nr:phosphodiester glycosidase family protein [Verrucomicrobiota bacterium]
TNAGMYDRGKTRPPVGLLIANGKRIRDINLGNGAGNFYKKPNGVFFVDHGQAGNLDSGEFAKRYPIEKTAVADATQSGPMLLINGAPRSDLPPTPNIRSAVGVASPTEIYFVLSVSEVSFLELATMMKDSLNCTDVLYLDGAISNMDTREQPSKAKRDRYAGIIGIVELAANR